MSLSTPPSLATLLPDAIAQSGADFEVVNVLDEVYNPGLREAIKTYSAWPTIPQVGQGGAGQGPWQAPPRWVLAGIGTPSRLGSLTCTQVFVSGEFIGGADIVEQMNGSGELPARPRPFPACTPLHMRLAAPFQSLSLVYRGKSP